MKNKLYFLNLKLLMIKFCLGKIIMKTLKKMVRVTKIPLEIWKDLDIEDRNDRFTLSQYINGISGDYLQNFVAHASLENALKAAEYSLERVIK